jgi:hypothetical protein
VLAVKKLEHGHVLRGTALSSMEQTTDIAVVHELQSNWRKVSSTHDLQVQPPCRHMTTCSSLAIHM